MKNKIAPPKISRSYWGKTTLDGNVIATHITPMDVFHSQMCTRRCHMRTGSVGSLMQMNAKGKSAAHAATNVHTLGRLFTFHHMLLGYYAIQ